LRFRIRPSPEGRRAIEIYDAVGEFLEFRSEDSEEERRYRAIVTELEAILRHGAAQALDALAAGREPMPSVVSAIARADPDVLDDPNVTGNLVLVLRTASVDVASLLHWILKMLGDHPEWYLRVREDASGDLARRIVLETLRLQQSEFIQRRVLEPVEIEGHTVPAGWFVRLCVRESHRDPEVFADPASFDPDRFVGRRLSRYEYSPFGRLEHRCIGETLTLALAGTFVSELARGYDWTVVRDGPPEFNRYLDDADGPDERGFGWHWRNRFHGSRRGRHSGRRRPARPGRRSARSAARRPGRCGRRVAGWGRTCRSRGR